MQFKMYLLIPYFSVKCVIHIKGYKQLAYKNNYLEKKKNNCLGTDFNIIILKLSWNVKKKEAQSGIEDKNTFIFSS